MSETNPDKHGSWTSPAAKGLRRGRLAIDGSLSKRTAVRDSGLSRPNASPAAKPRQSRTDTVETAG
ncbi:MAG: hypothetical protein IKJ45_00400 [Kiritimatiellae bacterium]|nr:hypothetical protein [Kiritimatiellia bacterium]